MDGAAELEVSAETDGHVIKASLLAHDGEKVGKSLGRVVVAAVACVDDRNFRLHGCNARCTLLGMAHGDYVGVAADGADGIRNALALCGRGAGCLREAENHAAELVHRSLKAEAGAGGRLIEQGRKLLAAALFGVLGRVCDYVVCLIDKLLYFGSRKVKNIIQMSQVVPP